ncbi:negative elongation factor B-like [Panonychus citri]|uniref:negative elongation factor B-like n=1 Tax=Panonychus citri TaxID=50023 RepID=UPI0023073993|nr:negative elongation factor B-like [Panonychus citri]
MNGLEEVGIPGREYLREALTNCNDPLQAIQEFQVENGILLPSLRTILPLLDLHEVRRFDFHQSVLEELKDKLLKQIDKMAKSESNDKEKKIKDLLEKSFPVIRIQSLQPIVMSLLKNLERIDDKYLKQIVAEKDLYEKCDISVKRQIWQQHQGLFGDEVSPLFSKYIKEKDTMLFSLQSGSFFALTPKQRRQSEIIQNLVKIIGRNVLLYDTCLQFLRTLFLRTKNSHYCTLRVDLLMALHDADVQDITSMDPCHKFAWCLDACIREQNVDQKRSRELQGFLEGVKRGQEQVIGDLSMTLCDPYAVNFLANKAIKIANNLINNESLARENTVLTLILRMLNLGLHSWDILNSQVYREPKLDVDLVTRFLPVLMSLIVDDQVRAVNSKLPPDDRESALTIIEHSGPPPDLYQKFITDDRLATELAIYYTLQVLRQKDRTAVVRVLGCLSNCHDNRISDDRILHSLVSFLIPMADEFSLEDFCTVVFDEIFLSNLDQLNVPYHLIKLMHHVYNHLPVHRLDLLIKTLTACPIENDKAKEMLIELEKKVEQFKAEVDAKGEEPPQEDIALPLPV